jgi:hypothetical protein
MRMHYAMRGVWTLFHFYATYNNYSLKNKTMHANTTLWYSIHNSFIAMQLLIATTNTMVIMVR